MEMSFQKPSCPELGNGRGCLVSTLNGTLTPYFEYVGGYVSITISANCLAFDIGFQYFEKLTLFSWPDLSAYGIRSSIENRAYFIL